MITLTTDRGQISIAPELITSVVGDADGSQINTTADVVYVKESRQEVVRKIMEYKLGTVQYGAWYAAGAEALTKAGKGADDNPFVKCLGLKGYFDHLAGLEDSDA